MTEQGSAARRPLGHAWQLMLVASAVLIAGWVAVPAGWLPAVLLLLLNAVTVGALAIGVRSRERQGRAAWLLLLATQTCSVAAFAYWYLLPVLTGQVLPVPSPADALFLVLYAGNCAAVFVLIRSERRGHDRETLLDILILSASLGALSWVFLMRPYAQDANLSTAVKLVSVAYPALDLVLVILTLRLAFSGSRTTPAKGLLVGWACFQLAGDTIYGVLALLGKWTLGSTVLLLWMAAFACLGAAGLHPTMATLGLPSTTPERGSGRARLAVVVSAVLVLPMVLTVRLVQGNLNDLPVIAGASVLVFLLALARGHSVRGTRATRGDRVALLRLTAGFVIGALLPLGLLAASSIRLAGQAVESDARSRVRTTSVVSAELVQQQMSGLARLVASYAQRPSLRAALRDGTAAHFDTATIDGHLAQLRDANPGVTGVFLTDAQGRLTDVLPSTPSIVGKDFSFRDWYHGVMASDRPYVSEAYQTAILGHPRVVAAASLVKNAQSGATIGVIAVVYDLKAIQAFAVKLADAQGVSLRITDQRGTVVAAPGADGQSLVNASTDAGVAAALAGRSTFETTAESNGDHMLAAYAPVGDIGWTVTAQVPTATAFASVNRLRSTVLAITVLLAQVLLGGLVLMARGQRQRREAERRVLEREEATRGILEAAADAFIAIDAAGVVTAWSSQSEELFGWPANEAVGSLLAELIIPAALRDRHGVGLARLAAGDQPQLLGRRLEMVALHRDGHEFPVELVIWQSPGVADASFNAFIHDITTRKRHEGQLAAARDEALEASRVKSEFLAVMSHELRTPMNGVMGMTSLLLETQLNPEQRDYAETVRSSADGLLDLLNDILDLAKIEADRLELESIDFDLHRVVRDVVHLQEATARHKKVKLDAVIDDDVRLALLGDPGRLRQVLLNLVGNALKFTSAGSVSLRVALDSSAPCSDPHQPMLRFSVTDTGIGIAPDEREKLFEAFSQADASTTRRYGGTGLGLAISSKLVALFGGEIGVDSNLGAGSTFWFTARFAEGVPVDAAVASVPEPRRAGTTRGHVLVVDDNKTNLKIAVRMLENLGHRADVAASGVDALDACARTTYDLVLMDCQMPIMDGYVATRAIRAGEERGRRTPIVAMTAAAMATDRERCLAAGMDDYLTKPVRLQEISAMVDKWLSPNVIASPAAAALETAASQSASPEAAPPATPSAAALDEGVVAGLRSLGPDFLARLVPVFVSSVPGRVAAIRAAIDGSNADALATAAHAFGGSAANMGAVAVAALCRQLEEAGRSGRAAGLSDEFSALEDAVTGMLTAVAALVEVHA